MATREVHLSRFLEYPRVETVEALTLAASPLSIRVVNHLDLHCVYSNLLHNMAQKGVKVVEFILPEAAVALSISGSLLLDLRVDEGNCLTSSEMQLSLGISRNVLSLDVLFEATPVYLATARNAVKALGQASVIPFGSVHQEQQIV